MSREAIEKIKIIIICPNAACGEQMRWERMASQYDSSSNYVKP